MRIGLYRLAETIAACYTVSMNEQLRGLLASLTTEERDALAANACTSVAYLYQLSGGHRKASALLAARLERASGGRVTREDLRPDLFGPIDDTPLQASARAPLQFPE